MTRGSFAIVLHQPASPAWMELIHEPYVESIAEGLSLPPQVVVRLKPDVTAEQTAQIADAFRARLDGDVVTVQFLHD
jgi:hypothetical protein